MFINGFIQPTAAAISAETLEMMWQMPLLGMGMIFAVLATLWAVLMLFKFIFARPEPKKKSEPAAPKAEPVAVPEPVVAPAANNDAELIAVLTAAIVAYEASHLTAHEGAHDLGDKREKYDVGDTYHQHQAENCNSNVCKKVAGEKLRLQSFFKRCAIEFNANFVLCFTLDHRLLFNILCVHCFLPLS